MNRLLSLFALLLLCFPTGVVAQEFTPPEPTAEHELLKQFEGQWLTECEFMGMPGQEVCKGSLSCRMLGQFWVINEMDADAGGQPMKAVQTIGYDRKEKKFIGTWVDSMTDFQWDYSGKWLEDKKQLVMEAEGPSFTDPEKKTDFRDSYQFVEKDLIRFESSMKDEAGKWVTFARGEFKRK